MNGDRPSWYWRFGVYVLVSVLVVVALAVFADAFEGIDEWLDSLTGSS